MDDQTPVPAATPVQPPADPNVADASVATTLTAAAQSVDPTATPVSRRGRELQPLVAADAAPEAAVSAGATEVEPARELEPEVEKTIESMTENKVNAPQNVVIAAEQMPTELPKTIAQPVVVLPLTEAKMGPAHRKGSSNSVRWLYEWCVRQIKKIRDVVVVYRE